MEVAVGIVGTEGVEPVLSRKPQDFNEGFPVGILQIGAGMVAALKELTDGKSEL